MNSFGKILAILLGAFIFFLGPLQYLAQKQDAITQNLVTTETVSFVDAIKNNGYFTKDMYESFLKKIRISGNVYEIALTHSHLVINPDEEKKGVEGHYYNTYTADIIEELEKEEIYYFSQGDYISIKVYNKNKTFAARLLQNTLQSEIPNAQIYVTYGGLIRDENY